MVREPSSSGEPAASMPGPSSRSGRARLLTLRAALLLAIALVAAGGPAQAEPPGYRCWTRAQIAAAGSLLPLRCRIGGGDVVEFPTRPVPLHPSVAEDLDGECWYERDDPTGWEVASIGADGSAVLVHYVGFPRANPAIRAGRVRRCFGEPAVSLNEWLVWRVVRRHDFSRPVPALDPRRGVTGLSSYLDLREVGPRHYVLDNPETHERLTVEITVAHIAIDWGEGGEPFRYRPGDHATEGYPNGTVRHVYESTRRYRVAVTFEWRVRWNSDGGPWHPMEVAPTSGSATYPVDQIVARVVR